SSKPKERDNEYLKQGLPAVEGLSNEFTNVKKAARIEHDTFINTCSSLGSRVVEIRQLVTRCASSERGGFLKEMKAFLEDCEEELKLEHPLQLFVIVKEFLSMVDRVCADISRNLQKKNGTTSASSPPPLSPPIRSLVKFINLPKQFMSDIRAATYSSESNDSF
ncbi:hypothetical protein CISIN_1g036431mg, partial [Citrus sinensis]